MAPLIDTHCHLYWDSFAGDLDETLARAREAGVLRMVVVGTSLETSLQALDLAERHAGIWASVGVHPHDAADADEPARQEIERLARHGRCVAIGETGLDWFRNHSPRPAQLENFAWQLDLARRKDLPVIVHCREAHQDVARLVGDSPHRKGVMHCYAYGPQELAPYLAAGYHISFSGAVTYPKNEDNRRAARVVPLDRLLIETDAPFLAPQGRRGKRNEPAFVSSVLECIARERGMPASELAEATTANANRLFGLPA